MRAIAVPVKPLSRSKSRLSSALSPLERGALTLAMLEDVLDACLAVPGWQTWVVSPDEAVLEIAARRGAQPVPEAKPPLSAAVRQAEEEAIGRGDDALAVLLADCPLVTAEVLTGALRTLGPVVAAPSNSDGGTNLLLRRPPRAIPARFGKDSLKKHVDSAAARGLPTSVLRIPELAFDLDLPKDVPALLASGRNGRTKQAILQMDLQARLPVRA